mmetsp:Transcript_26537/g.57623  ORF Transcript_26537/g.57623 Transcript_26537/m.57623 type:complete len:203 (+) Transcript_26537:451-1059(+)
MESWAPVKRFSGHRFIHLTPSLRAASSTLGAIYCLCHSTLWPVLLALCLSPSSSPSSCSESRTLVQEWNSHSMSFLCGSIVRPSMPPASRWCATLNCFGRLSILSLLLTAWVGPRMATSIRLWTPCKRYTLKISRRAFLLHTAICLSLVFSIPPSNSPSLYHSLSPSPSFFLSAADELLSNGASTSERWQRWRPFAALVCTG